MCYSRFIERTGLFSAIKRGGKAIQGMLISNVNLSLPSQNDRIVAKKSFQGKGTIPIQKTAKPNELIISGGFRGYLDEKAKNNCELIGRDIKL